MHVTRVSRTVVSQPVIPAPYVAAQTAAVLAARDVVFETLGKSNMSVKERFDTLEERFIPGNAKGVNARWQFLLSGPGGGEWWVEIKGGKITVKKGKGPGADVTIKATAENYLKIANEEVSSIRAYLTGMIKFDGSKDLAKQFKEFFKQPSH